MQTLEVEQQRPEMNMFCPSTTLIEGKRVANSSCQPHHLFILFDRIKIFLFKERYRTAGMLLTNPKHDTKLKSPHTPGYWLAGVETQCAHRVSLHVRHNGDTGGHMGRHWGDLKQMERTDYLRWSSTPANEKQNGISWLLQDNFHLQRRLFRDNKSHHQRPLLVSEGNGWCWWSVKHSVTNFYLASRARYWLHTIRLFQSNLIPFVFSNGFGLPRIISFRIDHITLISRFCPQPPPPMSTAWHCCFSDPLPNLLRRLMVILFMALLWPAR